MSSSRRGRRRDALLAETQEAPKSRERARSEKRLTLTILHHPEVARVGEVAVVHGQTELSRVIPDFAHPGSDDGFPLADPFISRRPLKLQETSGGAVVLTREEGAVEVWADGKSVGQIGQGGQESSLSPEQLEHGVVLQLGQRVVLLLHQAVRGDRVSDDLGLVGENWEMHRLRQEILRIANLKVPVLLRGETGTGKELVAQAIHRSSDLAAKPCLSVNMAAVHASVAASELFGHVKGAFTGAVSDHDGYFLRADGGTLFLDEIGETPVEVQVMLLRTLETGTIQPVGGHKEQQVDVRLVTATDADLDAMVKNGAFRPALVHRLAGYEIHLPPLRERLDDLGRLLIHFLGLELEKLGESDRLELKDPSDEPWLSAEVVARLAGYNWPGNVRQLRNVARQLVIANRDDRVRVDRALERLLHDEPAQPATAGPTAAPAAPARPQRRRKPSEVAEEELIKALKANRWRLEQTATALSISRASLYMLIEKSDKLRKAKDIPKDELERVYNETDGDLDLMAEKLEVSKGGLRLRVKEIM